MRNQELVLIQPGSGKDEKLVTVARALHFVAQCTHEGATLMFTHSPDAKAVAGRTLMLVQRAASSVHRFERGDLGIPDAELGAEMPPQARRDDAFGVKQLSTEANEADV